MVKQLFYTSYYHIQVFLRVKQAVFFAFAFPVLIFILFGNLFATNETYIFNLFCGVIGMTIASSGFFGIGTVIREYYANGWLKHLKHLPIHPLTYFTGLISSRIFNLLLLICILSLIGALAFSMFLSLYQFLNILLGVFIGYFIFSFLGLCLSFAAIRQASEYSLSNIIYYILLFTSTAFYPTCDFNQMLCTTGNILPLNPILDLMRNGNFQAILLVWIIVPVIVFYFLISKVKFSR
jgi:ABC-2 type transport system permease protein